MSTAREAYRLYTSAHLRCLLPIRNGVQRDEVRSEIRGYLRTLRGLKGV